MVLYWTIGLLSMILSSPKLITTSINGVRVKKEEYVGACAEEGQRSRGSAQPIFIIWDRGCPTLT